MAQPPPRQDSGETHTLQMLPLPPQAALVVPAWQTPFWQQPFGHVVESQGRAQVPSAVLQTSLPMQPAQAAPPVPHWLVV
jgi:hypothetical protein